MSAPPPTMRNPDPHCGWFLTGNGAAWFMSPNQQATAAAKSSFDRHSDRSTVTKTPPAGAQQSLRSRRPRATILIATVKSP